MKKRCFFWRFCADIMGRMIQKEDRKFLIQGLPVYLLMLVLIAGMVVLYHRKLSRHGNETLPVLISKNLQGFEPEYHSIDDVINKRKTWEPALPQWQGRELPNLTLYLAGGEPGHLTDYRGRECIVVLGATWFPPFRLQISQILQMFKRLEGEKPAVVVLMAESAERIDAFLKEMSVAEKGQFVIGRVETLPEPFSLPDGFPCLFFVDAQGRLKLAATGLVPWGQLKALCTLPLPQGAR